jgi:hypothetical protein
VDTNQGIAEVADQIDRMVETVVTAPGLNDDELRRVLRFLSQLIQVVEQAFQDVLILLIDIKYVDVTDLASPRLQELRKQLELLTARSHFRDAAEICSRLRHLQHNFDEYVQPVVSRLTGFSGWGGVFGLIEEHEGRIITLINQTTYQLSNLLDDADENTLCEAKAAANESAESLRSLLGGLHDLNGKILGYSGKTGFLELTRDRNELQREVKIVVNRGRTIVNGPNVKITGDNVFDGPFVVATTVQDSFNKISQSAASEGVNKRLELLCSYVDDLAKTLSIEKQKEITRDLSNFVDELTKEAPRRKWYELSAEGLVDAAKACAGLASPIVSTVKEVLALVNGS